jgi:hypothetical protein
MLRSFLGEFGLFAWQARQRPWILDDGEKARRGPVPRRTLLYFVPGAHFISGWPRGQLFLAFVPSCSGHERNH